MNRLTISLPSQKVSVIEFSSRFLLRSLTKGSVWFFFVSIKKKKEALIWRWRPTQPSSTWSSTKSATERTGKPPEDPRGCFQFWVDTRLLIASSPFVRKFWEFLENIVIFYDVFIYIMSVFTSTFDYLTYGFASYYL